MERLKKVLVVDDDKGIRYLLSDILSGNGFQVSMAKDGQESLDCLEKEVFDLVITDIRMPRLDGIEMMKQMKRAGRREKIIVMSATPGGLGGDLPQIFEQIQKPFDFHSFINVVAAAMAGEKRVAAA
jgi:CheY-like chemotaxis protein